MANPTPTIDSSLELHITLQWHFDEYFQNDWHEFLFLYAWHMHLFAVEYMSYLPDESNNIREKLCVLRDYSWLKYAGENNFLISFVECNASGEIVNCLYPHYNLLLSPNDNQITEASVSLFLACYNKITCFCWSFAPYSNTMLDNARKVEEIIFHWFYPKNLHWRAGTLWNLSSNFIMNKRRRLKIFYLSSKYTELTWYDLVFYMK